MINEITEGICPVIGSAVSCIVGVSVIEGAADGYGPAVSSR